MLPQMPRKALYGVCFAIAYPFVAGWLFAGGGPLQPTVDSPLWGGLFLTLIISIVGIVASFPIGIVLALGRRSTMPVVKALCVSFIELVRGVPLVTVLFMASVMLPLFFPPGWTIDRVMRALIGVSLFSGAYMAEVIRGGLQAIPKGQFEAADAHGARLLAEDAAGDPAAGAAPRDPGHRQLRSSRCSRTPRWCSSSVSTTCSTSPS